MSRKQIDFRFSKNWKTFLSWYEFTSKKTIGGEVEFDFIQHKVQSLFEDTVPNVVNWKRLWNDFS